jgi:hypothetical protein
MEEENAWSLMGQLEEHSDRTLGMAIRGQFVVRWISRRQQTKNANEEN